VVLRNYECFKTTEKNRASSRKSKKMRNSKRSSINTKKSQEGKPQNSKY
tara:strand:+ start:139 stop:285 length:147 start_codon:yes stop_codon:yes gene_type:complete